MYINRSELDRITSKWNNKEKKQPNKQNLINNEKQQCIHKCKKKPSRTVWLRFIVFNATLNQISAISWRSVLLEETGVPEKNHQHVVSH